MQRLLEVGLRGTGRVLLLGVVCSAPFAPDDCAAQCPPPGGYGGGGSGGGWSAGPSGPSSPSSPSTPSPTSPTTPSPSSPSPAAPSPEGPATGGGPRGVPGATTAGGGPRGGAPSRRGAAITFSHGRTTKKILEIDWDYPVFEPKTAEAGSNGTAAAPVRRALPREEAFRLVAGDDKRPLLVLRECFLCQGTDVALLSHEFSNERTQLLTHWFHCVKLPANVTQADHPFHELFPTHSHLFLCLADGTKRIDFDGKQTQKQLWRVMSELLDASYEGNPEECVREMTKLLAQFNIVDDKETRLLKDLDSELDKNGPKSPRVIKLQAELREISEEKAQLLAKEKRLRMLRMKVAAAAK